jgi:uncharacterized glyoxalase superfamily protein PhnB
MTSKLAARMLLTLALAAAAVPGWAQSSASSDPRSQTPMSTAPQLKHLTPVLVVDQVEPCLKFWSERFGFKVENQVPGPDGKLVFASVQKDGVEVMYQTRASVLQEDPNAGPDLTGHSIVLFLTVDDIDAVEKAVAGAPIVRPRHQTFYGSTEIYVREPGGNTVGFAQMGTGAAK